MPVKLNINYRQLILYVLLFGFSLLPALCLAFFGSTFSDSVSKKIGLIALSGIFIILPFIVFKARTAFLVNGVALLFVPVEIIHILFFKASVNASFIMLVLQTDFREILELLNSMNLIVLAALVFYFAYFFLVLKFVPNKRLFSTKNISRLIISAIALLFLLYSYGFYINYGIIKQPLASFEAANQTFQQKLNSIYPISFFKSVQSAYYTHREVNETDKDLASFSFGAQSENDPNQKEIYVLIIGETARYSNIGINGYHRNTSPQLSELENLVSFHNVLSEACNTVIALPTILTRSTATDFDRYKSEKSVLEAFKEAGFSTYWIANQSSGYPLVRRIFKQCDEHFVTTKDFDSVENYDEYLYPYLDSVLARKEKKQFIVIHTLGSHFRYNFRYPKEFKVFQPDFEGAFGYDLLNLENKDRLINSYDNSILYTDFFLNGVIDRVNQANAQSYMFYLSDHAENLFEEGKLLHGSVPNYYSMHIPLFVWYSDIYKKNNLEKVSQMEQNKYKKISASVSFHSLLHLAGISIEEQNSQKSIASKNLTSDSIHYALSPDKLLYKFKYK